MSNELTIVCNFSVADNRVRQLEDGSYKTINTTWRRVAAYKNAEAVAENLTKGARVIIRGIEEMRTYTRTDGTPGNQLRFIASVVGIVPTLNQRLTTLETAYDASTEATAGRLKEHTEELKTHTETLKEANRRANWQDQRIADLSDKLRATQIWLTFSFALIIILTVISSFFH